MFDDMIPWERDVYVGMIVNQVAEDNEKEKIRQQERKAKANRPRR